jgi:nucleoside-diphosphate kinase
MERSLVLIKPDAIQRNLAGAIINRLQQVGLRLVAIKMIHLDRALAQRHYAVHSGKPFFKEVVEYITSAPIIAIVFEGENAVAVVRKTMGATDPNKAEVGTIRGDFGLNIERNAVHGSDSIETAEEEIKLFFTQDEIFCYLGEADS